MDIDGRKYAVVNTSDQSRVNFDEVLEAEDTVRYSNDQGQFIVKYDGEMPDSLRALRVREYSYDDIRTMLITDEAWIIEEEPGLYD